MESEEKITPEGWVSVPLNHLVSPSKEKVEPRDDPDAFYIGLEHIEPNTTRIIGHGFARDTMSTKTRFTSGSILYGKLRPYLNKVTIPDFGGVCSTDILVFPSADAIDARYLMRFLSTSAVVDFATHQSSGMELPRTNYQKLGQLQVPLPPLAEQRRIVARLEALLADVERVRGRLDTVAATMQRFRQAVIHAVLKQIEEYPEVQLKDVISNGPQNGLYKSSDYYGRGTPIVRIDSFYDGKIRREGGLKRLECSEAEIEKYGIEEGDILINRVNSLEFLGKCALIERIEEPTVFESNMMRIGPDASKVDGRFLTLILCSPIVRDQIIGKAKHAVNQASINQTDVTTLSFFCPPLPEQHEIVRRVDALFALADRIEGEVAGALERVEALAQAVLAKAFRGELVPTEAELARRGGREYEPAGVLLERVRAGRTIPVKSPRLRKNAGTVTLEAFGE